MTNKEIARSFQVLADLMELHGENTFRVRTYQNAYILLRKVPTPLAEMSREEMEAIKGVGKSLGDKIQELLKTGTITAMRQLAEKTPPGVVEMLHIKGVGPKKVLTIWKELEIETIGELWYACNENRLIELYGFGKKTQEEIRKSVEFYTRSRGMKLFADAEAGAAEILEYLKSRLNGAPVSLVGEMRRLCPVINKIEILVASGDSFESMFSGSAFEIKETQDNQCIIKTASEFSAVIYKCDPGEWGSKLFRYTGHLDFIHAFMQHAGEADFRNLDNEKKIFEKAGLAYIEPELREDGDPVLKAANGPLPELLHLEDIKGVIHNHTTYSDGLHDLEEMAKYAQSTGYEYIVITDHSKSAFYANGLKEDRLREQWMAIEDLNKKMAPFRIFKGIESDILNDGSLDYPEDILKQFDCVIASIHSNLRMDEFKATERLIKAVENPYTKILGHPTGRLLLSRSGYPINHQKVIDACAANGVSIEINANPYRLDIDYQWIPYAMEKGVLISVNPDAHSKEGMRDTRYGVFAARKGGLTKEYTLNAKSLGEFEAWLKG